MTSYSIGPCASSPRYQCVIQPAITPKRSLTGSTIMSWAPDVPIPAGADPGAYLLLTANRGDAFLGWCTAAAISVATNPSRLQSLQLPADIAVTANYGLTLRTGAPLEAGLLRDFILSPASQVILAKYGFDRV
jgi:molybdate transport system substrate-binding protein